MEFLPCEYLVHIEAGVKYLPQTVLKKELLQNQSPSTCMHVQHHSSTDQ